MLAESELGYSRGHRRSWTQWIYLTAACLAIMASLTVIFGVVFERPLTLPYIKSRPSTSVSKSKDGLEGVLGPLRQYDSGFTIVAPTYHRTESLPEFLDNYATGHIPSLKQVLVIWNNEEEPPASLNETIAQYPVPVKLERRAKNSKNERFRRTPGITTAAVFALDDDMVINPRDVEYGFQAWQTFHQPRTRMVGYIRRREENGLYRMSPSPDGYSMVLTKSAFIHVDWMDLWWADTQIMKDFRDYVEARKLPEQYPDLRTGCEDIAMAYLYAHHSRVPPLWVSGSAFHDTGHSKLDGISTQPGHNDARTACVQHFNEVFGNDTLVNTQIYAALYEDTSVENDRHGE